MYDKQTVHSNMHFHTVLLSNTYSEQFLAAQAYWLDQVYT